MDKYYNLVKILKRIPKLNQDMHGNESPKEGVPYIIKKLVDLGKGEQEVKNLTKILMAYPSDLRLSILNRNPILTHGSPDDFKYLEIEETYSHEKYSKCVSEFLFICLEHEKYSKHLSRFEKTLKSIRSGGPLGTGLGLSGHG